MNLERERRGRNECTINLRNGKRKKKERKDLHKIGNGMVLSFVSQDDPKHKFVLEIVIVVLVLFLLGSNQDL